MLPDARVDMNNFIKTRRQVDEKVRNAYWFAHERLGSKARVHYGDIYALPAELGDFDVAVMCSVLLHVRDPLHVFENCARIAETLVVTDVR